MMPENAKLTPWPDGQAEFGGAKLPKWDSLSIEEKKLFIKQIDVYGAYLAYTDHEIGRVIQAVEDLGQLDNTLIIYISGDNGASAEGMINGTPNEFTTFNGVEVPVKDQFLWYAFWGSDRTFPHFSARLGLGDGHAVQVGQAGRVAFRRDCAGHGDVVARPHQRRGGIRRQFHHVIDIAPTILEATGVPAPDAINGIKQRPIEGVSMAYTWNKANASAPTPAQYAIFRDARQPRHLPRRLGGGDDPGDAPLGTEHEPPQDVDHRIQMGAYNVAEDPTQSNDLAAKMPDKLKQMQDLFYAGGEETRRATAR